MKGNDQSWYESQILNQSLDSYAWLSFFSSSLSATGIFYPQTSIYYSSGSDYFSSSSRFSSYGSSCSDDCLTKVISCDSALIWFYSISFDYFSSVFISSLVRSLVLFSSGVSTFGSNKFYCACRKTEIALALCMLACCLWKTM